MIFSIGSRITVLIAFLFIFSNTGSGQDTSSTRKYCLKIDLVSLYDDFFDSKVQVRAAVELERHFNKSWIIGALLDAGKYDQYSFFKYYDFFNQGPGLYSDKVDVRIAGAHLIPGISREIKFPARWRNLIWKPGMRLDYSVYFKKSSGRNGLTGEEYIENGWQQRLGAGFHLGLSYKRWAPFIIECRTAFLQRIFSQVPSGSNEIRALHSVWNSENMKYWWNYSIYLGYEF